LQAAYDSLTAKGVRFTPGGIRKGAGNTLLQIVFPSLIFTAGHNVAFIHPKGSVEFPLSSEGVLVELVQAPPEVITQAERNKM
jgi:lactoylglutathione lyase